MCLQYDGVKSIQQAVIQPSQFKPFFSEDKVLLHRVARQFDPSQFLNPNFGVAANLFRLPQGQQQAQPRDSSSSSSNNNNASDERGQAQSGEGRQPQSGQGEQQPPSGKGRQPQFSQWGQPQSPGSMFGGQVRDNFYSLVHNERFC